MIPRLKAPDGDLVPELIHDLASMLKAATEPLGFLVGGHKPPLLLDGIALLFLRLFRLLDNQLRSHQLTRVGRQLLLELPALLDNVTQLLMGIIQFMVEGFNLLLALHYTLGDYVLNKWPPHHGLPLPVPRLLRHDGGLGPALGLARRPGSLLPCAPP
ncbi:hypothetical protein GW17_00056307 [Ensete ventricosum]|nr:hypothetical protein GW17_00056307 [Ensete ventricosum]